MQDRKQILEQTNTNEDIESATSQELAMSISELSSKIYLLKTYKQVISNPIHGCQWGDVMEEELYNLQSHHN